MKSNLKFPPGSAVYVKGYKKEGMRIVAHIIQGIEGGRALDMPVDRCRGWNVADLRRWVTPKNNSK